MSTSSLAPISLRSKMVASVLLLAAPVITLVAAVGVRDRVPDLLPHHWGVSGEVDGTTDFSTFMTWLGIGMTALLLFALALVWVVKGRHLAGFSAALGGWLLWFVGGVAVATLVAARDVATAEDVPLPWQGMLLGAGVALLIALALSRLVPSDPYANPSDPVQGSALTLGAEEKVVWIGGAVALPFLWVGAVVAAFGLAFSLVNWITGLGLLFIGLVMVWAGRVRVRIDESGVRAGYGPGAWPAVRTPLSEIAGVGVAQVRPGEWGGWGYRMSSRGTAVLVRGGEGLVVRREGRKDLLITVDGADMAATVLQALLDRRSA